ncbi:MAG TPA: spermine/spermidine synthase [bacterium]|jgi:spermidine synthase|nr:spermine/spermidine synthase [bacterium]
MIDSGSVLPDPVPSGREVIARVTTPTGEWQLQRRGEHYEIICNGIFLMATYNRESDRRLAQLPLARLADRGLRVLVGGLGIGYTLEAALEDSRVQQVDVVEIEPLIVDWHRQFFAALCHSPCDDPRTRVIVADLFDVSLPARTYDAVLLDTDNGPDWLVNPANARIYSSEGIRYFLDALVPGGILAYWSADRAPDFDSTLTRVAGHVDEIEVVDEIAPGRSGSAWLYLAGRGT